MRLNEHPDCVASEGSADQQSSHNSNITNAAPISESQRSFELDVLRGVAILGILPMNIQYFSQITAAYNNPALTNSLSGREFYFWFATHLLFEEKMMALLCLLYGTGIVIFSTRLSGRGLNPLKPFLRKSLLLLAIGLLHAYLIWSGDILVSYALCGILVYPLRGLAWKRLLLIGFLLCAISPLAYLVYVRQMDSWSTTRLRVLENEIWQPIATDANRETASYRGNWMAQMPQRAREALLLEGKGFLYLTLWRASGLMLIGGGLYKVGLLTGRLSASAYLRLGIGGLLAGVPIIVYGVYRDFCEGWNFKYAFFIGSQYNYWGSLGIVLFWISIVMLGCQSKKLRQFSLGLSFVGRMALSNYIFESIVCSFVFYGSGLGLYGRINRAESAVIVVAIWVIVLSQSQVFLKHFKFGPLEWVWRSLTYCNVQPYRR